MPFFFSPSAAQSVRIWRILKTESLFASHNGHYYGDISTLFSYFWIYSFKRISAIFPTTDVPMLSGLKQFKLVTLERSLHYIIFARKKICVHIFNNPIFVSRSNSTNLAAFHLASTSKRGNWNWTICEWILRLPLQTIRNSLVPQVSLRTQRRYQTKNVRMQQFACHKMSPCQ